MGPNGSCAEEWLPLHLCCSNQSIWNHSVLFFPPSSPSPCNRNSTSNFNPDTSTVLLLDSSTGGSTGGSGMATFGVLDGPSCHGPCEGLINPISATGTRGPIWVLGVSRSFSLFVNPLFFPPTFSTLGEVGAECEAISGRQSSPGTVSPAGSKTSSLLS